MKIGLLYSKLTRDFFAKHYWDPLNHYYWGPYGVSTILEQEGLSFTKLSDKDLERPEILKEFEVIVISDQPFFTEKQEKALKEAHNQGVGLVFDGVTGWVDTSKLFRQEIGRIIPTRKIPQLASIQGLSGSEIFFDFTMSTHYISILNSNHMITHMLEYPEEQKFQIKHLPIMEPISQSKNIDILAESLHPAEIEKTGRGSILAFQDNDTRVVTFTFPAARWFRFKINNPLNPVTDSDLITYPIDCTSDSIRLLMIHSIQWVSKNQILVKKYYWPKIRNSIPKAVIATNSDLCGGTDLGVETIKRICEHYNAHHTFMDGPERFYLDKDNIGKHDVALHISDYVDLETIKLKKKQLEKHVGRQVKGWARHGSTKLVNYPGIWQKAVEAGFEWSRFMYIQTAKETKDASYVRELESPGNRLPYYGFNPLYGRFENIIEIPLFDTTDDIDRLMIEYGHRLSRNEWFKIVNRRLEINTGNHVLCSYQIHGWVAGAGAGEKFEETGWRAIKNWRKATEDSLEMLEYFLRYAQENEIPIMTGTEINDWWRIRNNIEILTEEISSKEINIKINNKNYKTINGFIIEICLSEEMNNKKLEQIFVRDKTVNNFEIWMENGFKKILIPIDISPRITEVNIIFTSK